MSFAGGKNENIKTEMMKSSPYEWLKYCVDLLENFNVLEPSMEKSQRVVNFSHPDNLKARKDLI